MSGRIERRLAELGIALPKPAPPAGAYVPYVAVGDLVFVSGQITMWEGELRYRGRLGTEINLEDGVAAARLCAINLLAQLREACAGDLDRVRRVVRLGGFINAAPDFTEHPKVLNGASDLMLQVFGDDGRHARFAVGCASLPFGVAVEVEGVFVID